jgi:hypothetical protein
MSMRLLIGGLLAVTAVAFFAPPAGAAFHLWTISEVYSNSDGSVQFIELFTSSVGQTFTNGTQIKSNGNTFTFPASLSQDTTNKHMLLATAGFGSLAGGVTPDFTIPSHFFNPAGDTINYVFTLAGPVTFASAPTDGISSLNFPGPTTAVNSPTNLAGMSGSVNLAPPPTLPGDYNNNGSVDAADYSVWRDKLGTSTTLPNDTTPGSVTQGDYDIWKSNFGNHSGSGGGANAGSAAVPEPSTVLLLMFVAAGWCLRRRRAA